MAYSGEEEEECFSLTIVWEFATQLLKSQEDSLMGNHSDSILDLSISKYKK